MSALRRASRRSGTGANPIPAPTGFERSRFSAAGAGIGFAPVPGKSAGFTVDLGRVLATVPRRALSVEPRRTWQYARRARGRWPRTSFHLPSAARIRVRDKGRRR